MGNRMVEYCTSFMIFMLAANMFPLVFGKSETYAELNIVPPNESGLFIPFVGKPGWVDQDDNGVSDSLDSEIADRTVKGTASDYVNVTVMLSSTPSARDVDDFTSCGGCLTTPLWTKATYGFGGTISFDGLMEFVRRCSSVLLVEKEAISYSTIAYGAQQVGARDYVWDDVGLQGDSESSIAIVDTGIDATHVDFSPGFGDQNFSKKIVGWSDQIGNTSTPYDDNIVGHGSHCAGLAAGNGFFSTDASGNAIATSGYCWGWFYNRTTLLSGSMMVNKTGVITVKVRWIANNTSTISAVMLCCGNNSLNEQSWIEVATMGTPSPNTWYTLTYDVTALPSSGYDIFHLRVNQTWGMGPLWLQVDLSWPWTGPQDGFPAWTGIAPESKLVGVKVLNHFGYGESNWLISGIDWIITNRIACHITVASMSLGFSDENVTVDNAVVNLVNSGVTTVVAAGNRAYAVGDNYIYSPGSVDEVITVAAMNQFDNVASYSCQGGTSRYTGKTVKPDITAPGGSYSASTILSVDSSYSDGWGGWSDTQSDDACPLCGTSMAAPIVAGAANILIQAMGGYDNWQYTRSQALQPKMILLMTATETYPNLRESYNSTWSPTLDRGGKDVHEGYGRLNVGVAVDAVLRTYGVGDTAVDSLHNPPTLGDISVLGQSLAWARKVSLVSGCKYGFRLALPAGADYDLYLYNNTGTTYGEPAIVASSTTNAAGGSEAFNLTAPYTGTYYIVVKRATETTISGTFTLTSSSSPNTPTALYGPSPVTRTFGNLYSTNNVTDPEGNQIRYHFNVTGPGTPTYQNTTGWVASGTPANLTVTWHYADGFGNYTLQTWVEDSWGRLSNIYSRTVSMINEAPLEPAPPQGDSNGYVLTDHSYSVWSVDKGGDAFQFEFNWNDSSPNTITPLGHSVSGQAIHNWSRPGLYNVTARAVDEWSLASYWSNPTLVNITQNDDGQGIDAGDSFTGATPYYAAYSTGTLYQSSPMDTQDWYKFYAYSDGEIHVDMTPPSGCNFGVQLYDPSGSSRSGPYNGTSQQTITYTADSEGYWRVKIYSANGEGQYTFHISISGGGGCPYVYTWNGTSFVKDNNILPASEVGNGTDARDYYRLEQPLVPIYTTPFNSLCALLIREFEYEIDYIDQAKLLAVDHAQGTNIAVTPEGEILTYTTPASPVSCIDNHDVDRLGEIATMNGNVSDSRTYFQGYQDDWLVLNFGRVIGPYAKLILRDDQKCADICINVQILDAGGNWQTVETFHPRDYWAMEAVNLTAYVPASGDFLIRLFWTGVHRLDYVGLDTSSPAQVEVTSRSPALAVHSTLGVVTEKLLYDDEDCVELSSGQQLVLAFTMPNQAQGTARDFIFFTNGYYYTITS